MKRWASAAFRATCAGAVLHEVYGETGPWTTVALALSFLAAEVVAVRRRAQAEVLEVLVELQPEIAAALKRLDSK